MALHDIDLKVMDAKDDTKNMHLSKNGNYLPLNYA